jgi:hypothetical protein
MYGNTDRVVEKNKIRLLIIFDARSERERSDG